MTSQYDTYSSPLATRNASPEMLTLWSARHKFNLWRAIWLGVAKAQHEAGLPVALAQVEALAAVVKRGITDDELRCAEGHERTLRHDVMAHVHTLGDSCPTAAGIIHLGLTSQDVVCNADLLTIHQAISLIERKCASSVLALLAAAEKYADLPTLGFTHYQPAQPVTVGRRMANWAYDLSLSLDHLTSVREQSIKLRGLRGATGTQAALVALFTLAGAIGPPSARLGLLEKEATGIFGASMASAGTYAIGGQTYPRIVDAFVLGALACVASVLHKIGTDIRLLCNRKELDEPFETSQIGSSAMPYKRNPMRCERMCGLTRFVMNLTGNAYDTAAVQWLERTLDDSSNRRLTLPEAFLALDGSLDLMHNVASGIVVHEATVRHNLMAELPFMATENILMAAVAAGGDRQEFHEIIRRHAQEAGMRVKRDGLPNDLLQRLESDPAFQPSSQGGKLATPLDWNNLLDAAAYIGLSAEQTRAFAAHERTRLAARFADHLTSAHATELRV